MKLEEYSLAVEGQQTGEARLLVYRIDTNKKAPDIASRVIRFLCSFKVFLIDRNPAARKGRQSAPHAIQNPPGR